MEIFCEVCGYNFRTGQPGLASFVTPAQVAPPMSIAPATAKSVELGVVAVVIPSASTAPDASIARWDVTVEVDPNLFGTINLSAPTGRAKQMFSLFEAENIVGRATLGTRVHVPITGDEGVSRRHALLVVRSGPTLAVRDLGSANGTLLNGVELVPGVETPLKDGDLVAIGAWTRITIRGISK